MKIGLAWDAVIGVKTTRKYKWCLGYAGIKRSKICLSRLRPVAVHAEMLASRLASVINDGPY